MGVKPNRGMLWSGLLLFPTERDLYILIGRKKFSQIIGKDKLID